MKEVRERRTIRRVWTFGIPLAFEETFGDRERGKAELGSNAKLAQAQEILANIVCELSPGATSLLRQHGGGSNEQNAYITNALSSSSSSSFAKRASSSIASVAVNS
jgi:hypothetical protein